MAQRAQALLLNGQAARSWTLDNPKQEKSRTGDPLEKNVNWDINRQKNIIKKVH